LIDCQKCADQRDGGVALDLQKHRFQCEVRHVLMLRTISRARMDSYLELVLKRRGDAAMWKLKDVAKDQWGKGNRGEFGMWK